MPNENQTTLGKRPVPIFVPRRLPWILGGVMLVVYLATLNHWVNLANVMPVARVSGFLWQPDLYHPLSLLLTSPFRLLPVTAVPLALNLFSAVCAALAITLLARSVAILPQDRTVEQRRREGSAFAFLSTRTSWFPPALAVLMFGLEFTFWQSATNFTGEAINLLIFATIVWLLLEYRLDERPGRLALAAFLLGIGMTENWGLIGFLPLFIIALVWLRGMQFFNPGFLAKTTLCGLAGLLFFLLPPIAAKIFDGNSYSVWKLLAPSLQFDWQVIKSVSNGFIRKNLLLMSVTTFLPILIMSIRWSGTFGDSSRAGKLLAHQMIHLIHLVIFGVCLWVMFDPPFSPVRLAMGSPALSFYYLSALAIGYYTGYFLLVFGKKLQPSKRDSRPEQVFPEPFTPLIPVIYWAIYVVAGIMAITLIYKNVPLIHAYNDNTLARYAQMTVKSLPPGGAILLSDNDVFSPNPAARTLLIQEELARTGRSKDYLMVDTHSLDWAAYFNFLHRQAPDKWPELDLPKDKPMAQVKNVYVLKTLDDLSKSNTLCYLNPSYGFYFEVFYQEPHQLVYEMKKLPSDTLMPSPMATNQVAQNQEFWKQIVDQEVPRLEPEITPYNPAQHKNPLDRIINKLHGQVAPNPNATLAADLYSRQLNSWGVRLQQDNRLQAAAVCFTNALKLNADNFAAAQNLDFNQTLQAGKPVQIDPAQADIATISKHRNWNALLGTDGPFDDPDFLFVNSALVARNGLMRQTVQPFTRLRHLDPNFLPVRLWLAQIYLYNRLPDRALEALQDPMTQPQRFDLNATNSLTVNTLASYAYFQKNEPGQGTQLLEQEIAQHPTNTNLLTSAAQVFFMRGLYNNALKVIDRGLALSPDSPQWLFGKGMANLQMSNYDGAITAMTQVLNLVTNDPNARFNRALAYLKSDQLDKARADYATLQTTYTNAPRIAYGLGEIAWRQHNTNEAIRNYRLYLDNARTNTAEYQAVQERLDQLQKN